MKKVFFSLIIIVLLTGCSQQQIAQVVINNAKIDVELAITKQQQYQGLSQRPNLCHNCGMLFLVEPNSVPDFVMRDMEFDLDFVWINDDKIVDLIKQAPAGGSAPKAIYQPKLPIDYVLEVNAGLVDELQWQVGDSVELLYE